ncbi:MAG: 2'-5' RNA ligase family protein [Cyclobacteriaceae bacterium]|nr:2'-5' RNA ligase family protein [Cyclobacteriaceae bacterium]
MPEKKEDKRKLYFIGIVPPAPVFEKALQVKRYVYEQYGSKDALKSPPHITLHMPFKWDEQKEQKLIGLLTEFVSTSQTQPFELRLKNFDCFEPRVIFIAVEKSEPLLLLQKELMRFCKTKLNLFNATYKDHAYHPHLTVAFRDLKKATFYKAWEEFKSKEFKGEFVANAITLLKHNGKNWDVHREFSFI